MISLGNLDMKELFLSGREYVWVQIASKIYMCKVDGAWDLEPRQILDIYQLS